MNRLEMITAPLLSWFDRNARVLPWRENPTPYRVWISEIMLQQTRVEAVKPYYERFLAALPDVHALSACPQDRLLKLWEGLGYYNRARNLQKAAQILEQQYGGEMPEDYEKILSLPGIGSYTAGAVASIAYGIPVPAVDGNVMRVLARFTLLEEDVLKTSVKRNMEEMLKAVMPKDRPGAFNQALMELGAIVCVPNGPARCENCPLASKCLAHLQNRTDVIPVKTPKKARRVENRTVFVITDGKSFAVRKRPENGLLAGLYELPNTEEFLNKDQALALTAGWGLRPIQIHSLKSAKHIFSHVEWHMAGYAVYVEKTLSDCLNPELFFVEPFQTEEKYPIPAAFSAYMEYVHTRLGQERQESETLL